MSAPEGLEQPWESSGTTRLGYRAWAQTQRTHGKRLAIEALVNGYRNAEGQWFADRLLLTDADTGATIASYDPSEERPPSSTRDVIIVDREVIEAV